ncbi:MAG: AbrB/MazE/SpoVT family DNA-binding domain-containing protein [Caulobacteraceae bacterium]
MNAIPAKLSESGRLTVPAKLRALTGLEPGKGVVLDVVAGELRVRSVAQAMDAARSKTKALIKGRSGVSVDAFLAGRRRDAEREG